MVKLEIICNFSICENYMNHKRHKPRKQVRCTYCTENRIGNSGRTKDLKDEWRSVPARHPSWYCKKGKGKHEFLLIKEEDSWIFPGKWQTFRCSSCGKKKLKHLHSPTIVQLIG